MNTVSLCLSLRSKHHCSSLVSISILCGLRPFGPWTPSALSALCLIIHCCALALSSQPWLLHSLGQTAHEGSGWPAQSCLEHWQQLSHPICLLLPARLSGDQIIFFTVPEFWWFDGCFWVCKCDDRRDLKSWMSNVWSNKVARVVKTVRLCVPFVGFKDNC